MAVTERLAVIVTEQVEPDPEQLPPHANVHPANGVVRVNFTDVLYGYDWKQSDPQLIPLGDDVTVPEPVLVTDRSFVVLV